MKSYLSTIRFGASLSLIVIALSAGVGVSQTPATGMSRADSHKAEGVVRIGLVIPRVSLIGGGATTVQDATTLSRNVSGYLTGPWIGTIDLKARLESLALEEGKERLCDYVLSLSLIRKRLKAGPVTGGAIGGTRAGDEFTFEYKLVSTNGMQVAAANVARAEVKADGEDVLTPMIEAAAQAVVDVAKKTPRPAAVAPSPTENVDPQDSQPKPATAANTNSGTGYGSLTAPYKKTSATPAVADPEKAEGAIRIGIPTPRVTLIGDATGGSKEAVALRENFGSYLAGSTIETINLAARLDSLALNEGKKRQCDYVLYLSLVRKRQASGSGSRSAPPFGNIMSGAPGGAKIPGGKTAQTVSQGATSVSAAMAALAKAKDELVFEYRLVAIDGGSPVIANVAKAKVKSDGEDALTPLLETAAQAIVDVTKKD